MGWFSKLFAPRPIRPRRNQPGPPVPPAAAPAVTRWEIAGHPMPSPDDKRWKEDFYSSMSTRYVIDAVGRLSISKMYGYDSYDLSVDYTEISKDAKAIKPYFDALHARFVAEYQATQDSKKAAAVAKLAKIAGTP